MGYHYRSISDDAQPKQRRPVILVASIALFVSSLLLFLATLCIVLSRPCSVSKAWDILNAFSPIAQEIDFDRTIQETLIRGELGRSDDVWSQPPSPEVDLAWGELNRANQAWVTSNELLAAGKNLTVSVKLPRGSKYGDDAYPVLVDIKHQLHCLNRIRKDLHHNFDYYWSETFPDGKTSALHQGHTNHCIAILLHNLKCNAPTDIIAYAWYDGYDHPHPDFNIERKCGNFDGIQQWINSRRIQNFDNDVFNLEKPPGHGTLSMTREGLRLLGLFDV